MKNWAEEIKAGTETVKAEMAKMMDSEKLQKNIETIEAVAAELVANLDTLARTDYIVYGYKDAKDYAAKAYSMTGNMADHGSLKHKVAASIAHYI